MCKWFLAVAPVIAYILDRVLGCFIRYKDTKNNDWILIKYLRDETTEKLFRNNVKWKKMSFLYRGLWGLGCKALVRVMKRGVSPTRLIQICKQIRSLTDAQSFMHAHAGLHD